MSDTFKWSAASSVLNSTLEGTPRGARRLQTYHLVGEHEDSFETKLALAVVEEILKTRPEQVDNHDVVVALDAEPVHIWDTNYSAKKEIKSENQSI